MHKNCITDIDGITVGQVSDKENLTGCTVILSPKGARCGVIVRGSSPGTRETDALHPLKSNDGVHAVLLTGGSAFGLAAADGVMQYLEERNIGFDVGVTCVPIVPAAVIFDLKAGNAHVRPDKQMGYDACLAASSGKILQGNEGAGTGATVGKILGSESRMKGGVGSASVILGDGLIVGAIVAVNAFGDIRNPDTGQILAGPLINGQPSDTSEILIANVNTTYGFKRENTTIGAVATNADISKTQLTKMAEFATNGLIKTITPFGSSVDGDTVFALSYGNKKANTDLLGIMAAKAMSEAVINACFAAKSTHGIAGLSSES